jgi:hypothetical protein
VEKRKRNKYTKELLEQAVSASKSWSGVCRYLGVKEATGAQSHIQKMARKFSVDASHFTGQGWCKGIPSPKRKPTSDYLRKGLITPSHRLKMRLLKEGLKEEKCESCGLKEWLGEKIPLELDHINGDKADNTFENLRILCPNCHALTETYCKRKAA